MRRRIRIHVVALFIFACSLVVNSLVAAEPAEENKLVPEEGAYAFFILEIGGSKMIFNGKQEEIDPGYKTSPVLMNGKTLIPMRAIIEKLGGSLSWDASQKKIDITYNSKRITLQIGSKTAVVGDSKVQLDLEALVRKDRVMIPLRFVAENLGCNVYWHGNNTITISTNALKDTYSADRFSADDLSIYDAILKKQIRLGMTKDEIDAIYGFKPEDPFMGRYEYEGLQVFYRDGVAAGLLVSSGENLTTRFSTVRNVTFFSPKSYVQKKYGPSLEEVEDVPDGERYGTYLFRKEGSGAESTLVKLEASPPFTAPKDNLYYVSFLYDESKDRKVTFMLIGDYEFGMLGK
ncbi:copper amine oxidase N-terminal domain-containing protein [Paenibacillus sp. BC26]|uniref:copper amine oxidase N-terminal domain-containing protein n=1 Tax=Paenibacillus sp. BC26 TaxID=1881032 RepID=UPI0008EA5B58|nr:copper amine oxidase N-terminal domain-containing protein [Paenibacillus sp. BC26]SFS72989.1 Copper amine oxidase N-terminal domain-containing protein [Paenibacillus sp. BC26]